MFDLFDLFYTSGIATVSHIAYTPFYNTQNQLCNQVFITIHNWHDTENAYNFLKQINAKYDDAHYKIIYDEQQEQWWPVSLYKYKTIPSNAYVITNCLVVDTPTHYTQHLDLTTLPVFDKQLDMLTL